MAAISSPPTMPKASWCARPRPTTTRRRTRTRSRPRNLVRLAVLAGDDAWRDKADRLIEGVLGAAGENLIGHAALLNALDLRLRGAEIVITGSGERADALTAAARKLSFLDRIVLRAPDAGALPASHPAREQDRGGARRRGVRLRRRALFPAGHDGRAARPSRPRDGGAASSCSKLESLPGRSLIADTRRKFRRTLMRLGLALLFTLVALDAGARAGRSSRRAQHGRDRRQPLPHDLRDREQDALTRSTASSSTSRCSTPKARSTAAWSPTWARCAPPRPW